MADLNRARREIDFYKKELRDAETKKTTAERELRYWETELKIAERDEETKKRRKQEDDRKAFQNNSRNSDGRREAA